MRFDTVIMGGGLADYSVACNCKNTACAVPLSLVVKARCISHPVRWIC